MNLSTLNVLFGINIALDLFVIVVMVLILKGKL